MTRWTGADEAAYLRVLDRLSDNAAAIAALRRKYRVNAERPTFSPL